MKHLISASLSLCALLALGTTACNRRAPVPDPAPEPIESPVATPDAEPAAEPVEPPASASTLEPQQELNRKLTLAEAEKLILAHANSPDFFIRPGIHANRTNSTVELTVEATGIATNAITEFFLITQQSGHDYESLFTSLASARDLRDALLFLGMTPGRNALQKLLAFWPRGERLKATLVRPNGSEIPLESLVIDAQGNPQNSPLPETGFLFCGSYESTLNPGSLAADSDGPCSILSTYNEPTTLLDVPRQATQNAVYERFLALPDPCMTKHARLRLRLRPEPRTAEQGPRCIDRTLAIHEAEALSFTLSGPSAEPLTLDAPALVETFKSLVTDYDPYVTLQWDASVTLRTASSFAATLSLLDTEGGIHIEPPAEGQLYYRAFLPRNDWRDRASRPTQPCELRFARTPEGTLSVSLISLKEIWPEDGSSLVPTIEEKALPVPSLDAFPALLESTENPIAALLVFAPGDATLGDIMPYIRSVLESKPNVFLFHD